jgi:xylulokinase
MSALLGIDLGTGSVKAVVVDLDGTLLGHGAAEYPISHPHPGWAEQEPNTWWEATVLAVRAALAGAGGRIVSAIGLSGQMHGTVLLDGALAPLRPAIIWADTRSADQVAAITERLGAARLTAIAGSPLATGFQAATVAWVQKHEPDLWRRAHSILLPKDYLRLRLTGELATDPSDACSTLLFDVLRGDWSDELLQGLELDRALLPGVVESTGASGMLAKSAAGELGLAAGIPVAGGGADAPLAALAAGVTRPDQMALTISSGSQVMIPAASFVPDERGRIHAWRSCLPIGSTGAPFYQMGATLSSGLALRWLRDSVFGLEGQTGYERMVQAAARVPAGAGGLLFLPYLAGERTPHLNPRARGMLLGLTAEHGQGHLTRAVMEGAILALFDAFGVLRSLGAAPGEIVLSGGGARGGLWRQIVADIFGLPVHPLEAVEQSAVGAALLAGALTGSFELDTAANRWARYAKTVTPQPEAHKIYASMFELFRAAYPKHVTDFDVLAQMEA